MAKILLPAVIGMLTLTGALLLLRYLAPQLIGLPADLKLVQSSESLPPFYDGIFRVRQPDRDQFLINDPKTVVRALPLYDERPGLGPHDLLGFRNREIPNAADVIFIGDSQTYGNNVRLEENWPSVTASHFNDRVLKFYAMATGGWGAAQYTEIFVHAQLLRPRVVVVAFYTGNDALDTARAIAAISHYNLLIPEGLRLPSEMPERQSTGKGENWKVAIPGIMQTVFTPRYRLLSNQRHTAVDFGYAAMAKSARLMSQLAAKQSITLVTTIIPTKELVYVQMVKRHASTPPESYNQLTAMESERIQYLADELTKVSVYVDVLKPLRESASQGVMLYPENENGHPVQGGYQVIGETIANALGSILPESLDGLILFRVTNSSAVLAIIRENRAWPVNQTVARKNGWEDISSRPLLDRREMFRFDWQPELKIVDTARFGPR